MVSTSQTIHEKGLRSRVKRLLEGRAEASDIAHLYAGLRANACGRDSFREIGDFAAHPDLRNRGPSTGRLKDFLTVFEPLLVRAAGKEPSIEIVLDRALANLRMLDEDQLRHLFPFKSRLQLEKDLNRAALKMKNKLIGIMTTAEQQLLIDFGDRMIWNPAFRDHAVFDDFVFVLSRNGMLEPSEIQAMKGRKNFVTLYVLTALHGTRMDLGGGKACDLQAGYANKYGNLEITANLAASGFSKPVSMKVGLFWTEVPGKDFCDPNLGHGPWEGLIGIKDDRLVSLD